MFGRSSTSESPSRNVGQRWLWNKSEHSLERSPTGLLESNGSTREGDQVSSGMTSAVSLQDACIVHPSHGQTDRVHTAESHSTMSSFQHNMLRLEDPKSPSSTELSYFQFNLIKDQINTLTRDVGKLRQEVGTIRADSDRHGKSWEKGDAEILKSLVELRQALSAQTDEVDREVRLLRRTQGQDTEEFRAALLQTQRTVEEELKRLCVAVDTSSRHIDVIRNAVDREAGDRASADEAIVARMRDMLDAESQALSSQVEDVKRYSEQLRMELEEETKVRKEANEQQQAELQHHQASTSSEISAVVEQRAASDAKAAREISAVRQSLEKEARDRAAAYEDLVQSIRELTDGAKQEREERCSNHNAFQGQLCGLHEDFASTTNELRNMMQVSLDALDTKLRKETSQLYHDHQAGHGVLRDQLAKLSGDTDAIHAELRTSILEGKHEMQTLMHDGFAEERKTHDQHRAAVQRSLENLEEKVTAGVARSTASHQAECTALRELINKSTTCLDGDLSSVRSKVAEEQMAREAQHSTLSSSIEALQDQHKADHSSLHNLICENKSVLETHKVGVAEHLSKEKADRELSHASLKKVIEDKLSSELAQMESNHKTLAEHLQLCMSKVTEEHQAGNATLHDALQQHRSLMTSDLAEHKSSHEQTSRSIQSALDGHVANIKREIDELSGSHKARSAELGELVTGLRAKLDAEMATTRSSMDDSIKGCESKLKQVAEQHHSESATLKSLMAQQQAGFETFQDTVDKRFVQEQAARQSQSEELDHNLRSATGKISEDCQAARTMLLEHITQTAAEQDNGLKRLQNLLAETQSGLDAHRAAIQSHLTEEKAVQEKHLGCLKSLMEKQDGTLREEMTKVTSEVKAEQAALQNLLNTLKAGIETQFEIVNGRLAEERASREDQRGTVQATLDGLDAKLQKDLAQLANEHQTNNQSLRHLVNEHQAGLEHRHATLSDYVEKERSARDKGHTAIQDRIDEIDKKLHSTRTEHQDALRDLGNSLEKKLQSEIWAVTTDHRSQHNMIQEQLSEHKLGQDSLRNQLVEERSTREATRSTVTERLDSLERKVTGAVSKESMDREAGEAALRNLIQQQDNQCRADAKMESSRLWEAINTHTHDVNATTHHKVEMKQQKSIKGQTLQGNTIRSVSPTRAPAALPNFDAGLMALPNLPAGNVVTRQVSMPRSGSRTPRASGSMHIAQAPQTPHVPQTPHAMPQSASPAIQRYSSGPIPQCPSTSVIVSSTPVPTAATPVTIMPSAPPAMTATPVVQCPPTVTHQGNMMAGMMYSTETFEKEVDEIKSLSCGPAVFGHSGPKTPINVIT